MDPAIHFANTIESEIHLIFYFFLFAAAAALIFVFFVLSIRFIHFELCLRRFIFCFFFYFSKTANQLIQFKIFEHSRMTANMLAKYSKMKIIWPLF